MTISLKNKKGQMMFSTVLIIIFVFALFVLLFIGIAMALGGVVIDWTFDETVPLLTNIGMVGSSNMSSISENVVNPLNSFVQSFTWLSGVFYVMALILILGLPIAFKITGNKWLMAFFVGCMVLFIIGSVLLSNIYEDFYDDSGGVGDRLHEYVLLSFMILQGPMIMTIIGFIGGIIIFTGIGGDEN